MRSLSFWTRLNDDADMAIHELAGRPAPRTLLVNVPRLIAAYYTERPDPGNPSTRVSFGTSGHRGSSLRGTFNEEHILAVSQAVSEHRSAAGIDGPLFLGMDTHALSEAAHRTAVEVFAANGVHVHVAADGGFTPTPVISFAILRYNRNRGGGLADGVVVTPSHNPPEDGGFKYNAPSGGPADTDTTGAIERRANQLLADGCRGVKRVPLNSAMASGFIHRFDYVTPYVTSLGEVVDLEAVANAGVRIGVDPMGGAGIGYWDPIAERYGLDLDIVNPVVDPTFAFMRVDHDGRIRMDCSSPYAMAGLVALADRYDIAFGNDPDYDRHGIVTPGAGLMNPNHYLAAAVAYLYRNRPGWPSDAGIGKTLVSSSMMDRVAADLGRRLVEVPVGFKWFVDGLLDGSLAFGGEESAGASFLDRNGASWSTDKDGIIMDLLAAEMLARTGSDPAAQYGRLTEQFGEPVYARMDAAATSSQKALLARLSPDDVPGESLAGDPITAKLTKAPGNGAAIGGLKVTTDHGWFAARPSGTEEIYKIYAESFRGADHLERIQTEAQRLVGAVFESAM